jgi:hypothetical protein
VDSGDRWVEVEGADNLRDLGGLPTGAAVLTEAELAALCAALVEPATTS